MADTFREGGINVALSQVLSERLAMYHKRVKDIAKGDVRETGTRRRIEGQLHLFCDLAQALLDDGRSKKAAEYNARAAHCLASRGQAK
ncbi:MAG: hypothetical protein ACXV3D_01700 [Halobacteriota archaeon]